MRATGFDVDTKSGYNTASFENGHRISPSDPIMLAVVLATAVTSALRLESLPRSFDKGAFESFASQRPSLLASRWGEFLQQMGPLSAEAARLFTTGRLRGDDAAYARATREALAR